MPENIKMELPLNSEEETVIKRVSEKLVVEFGSQVASKADIKSAIKAVWNGNPNWAIKTMIKSGYMEKEGENLRLINNKGGEKMEKDYSTKITSGESKVSEAILDEFGRGFQMKGAIPEIIVLECFEKALPRINKRAKANLALKKMLQGEYLEEKDGKISLGEKGVKYLRG